MKDAQLTKPFNLIGLGGSFDHLHDGHLFLLKTAAKLANHITIGLTTDEMIKHKSDYEKIQSYDLREELLHKFLEKELLLAPDSFTIFPLSDPYGPTLTDATIDAHISSEETHETAIKINQMRIERGLPPMILVIIPLISDSKGEKISSTSIRSKIK